MPVTEVEFHTQTPDRLLYACRLLRKAATSAARILVTADADTLKQLDQQLWSFSSTDFVPHCLHDAPAQVSDVLVSLSTDNMLNELLTASLSN